jgi:uncharacterized protein
MSFDTSIRDAAVARERAQREAARKEAFKRTVSALEEVAREIGLKRAYVFGSVVRPGWFRRDSDVDIAVEGVDDSLSLAVRLSSKIGREVHVVPLGDSAIATRARREGVEWTPKS